MPQLLTWNMGTTGRMASEALQPRQSGSAAAMVCSTVLRWL